MFWSLPSWERGLKQAQNDEEYGYLEVAPLVGAWIETTKKRYACALHKQSLPSWERGLKP